MALFMHQTLQQIVSSRKITRPLQLKAGKPAGKGTITVRAHKLSYWYFWYGDIGIVTWEFYHIPDECFTGLIIQFICIFCIFICREI